MKIKTSKLTGAALDWAVAKCEGVKVEKIGELSLWSSASWHKYSSNWAQGGPILSRERISRTIDHSGLWIAYWSDGYTEGDEGKQHMQCDRSELVAGLRCVVALKLGDEIEIPEELT